MTPTPSTVGAVRRNTTTSHSSSGGILNLDDLICRVLNVGSPNCSLVQTVSQEEIVALCDMARAVFLSQPSLVEVEPPIKVCGDTHGQFSDVIRLFSKGGFPPFVNYLFLGDYVDRGHQNLECIILFLAYKAKYPANFFLLRGNHECPAINRVYGFYEECQRRYQSQRIWSTFQDVFATLPFTGLVGGRILCMHGGLSPKLKVLDQLRQIVRPIDPPNPSLHMDLLWADPDLYTMGWQANSRGVSYVFGPDVVLNALTQLDIDLVARAHQVVQDGYEFFASKKMVTIFSAPHYCGQFDNAAAMMSIDENMVCCFQVMKPNSKINRVRTR